MLDPVLQAPDLKLAADSNQVLNYKRDANNYITQLFGEQLPAIRNGFFNAHMSRGFIVQPHWHTNVTEMIFVISGELIASVFDPFTPEADDLSSEGRTNCCLPEGLVPLDSGRERTSPFPGGLRCADTGYCVWFRLPAGGSRRGHPACLLY